MQVIWFGPSSSSLFLAFRFLTDRRNYISGLLYGNVLLFVLNSREHLRSLGSSGGNTTSHSQPQPDITIRWIITESNRDCVGEGYDRCVDAV